MTDVKQTPALAIVIAWLIVGVPASWGVYNTALNAKKLFVTEPRVVAPSGRQVSPSERLAAPVEKLAAPAEKPNATSK